MTGTPGCRAFRPRTISHRRLDHPAAEFVVRQDARPAVENLHGLRAGLDLPGEVIHRAVGDEVDQPGEILRVAEGGEARRRLVRRAMAGDHVGRDRPGPAAKADQRFFGAAARRGRARRFRKSCRIFRRPRPAFRRFSSASGGMASRRGPTPSSNATFCPSASGTIRMSANRIAASKSNRRIGCSVISAAHSGR